MTTTAVQARQEAMGMLTELYWPATGDYQFAGGPVSAVADNIAKLAALGRTDRWRKAITRWADEVRQATPETLHWAYFQFAVYAGHASE
jgi:hypothetical protein